jgi:hypothetical protein
MALSNELNRNHSPLTIIPLTFRSLDEWFRATLVPKAELSFRTPRRWRVQGALPKGRKVLERGAPAPLFKAPSRHGQAKTNRKGAKARRRKEDFTFASPGRQTTIDCQGAISSCCLCVLASLRLCVKS